MLKVPYSPIPHQIWIAYNLVNGQVINSNKISNLWCQFSVLLNKKQCSKNRHLVSAESFYSILYPLIAPQQECIVKGSWLWAKQSVLDDIQVLIDMYQGIQNSPQYPVSLYPDIRSISIVFEQCNYWNRINLFW